jgi:capsular exopolysaccharide synthesis family protein
MDSVAYAGPETRPLRESVAAHKWSVLTLVVVISGLILALSYQQTPKYQSSARVVVQSDVPTAAGATTDVNLETEQELADSPAVAALAHKELPADRAPEKPEALLDDVSVELLEETEILEFSYTHPTPEVAQERAQAFAGAYIDYRRQQLQEIAETSAEAVQQEIRVINQRLNLVNQRINQTSSSTRLARLQAQENTLLTLLLEKELKRAELSDIPPLGAIIQPADLPRSPSSPNHVVDGVFGVVLGLGAGVGYAAFRSRRAEQIPSSDQIETYLGAPVVGTIPRLGGWRQRPVLVTDPEAPPTLAEAYRILRTNLLSIAEGDGVSTVAITSARPGEGKTLTAANLALVVARSGKRVVLVSADLRSPRLSELFGRPAGPGLTDVLAGRVPLEQALLQTRPYLELLPGGAPPEDPAHVLGSAAIARLLAELAGRADLVIIDTPPALGMADTVALGPLVGGVLFVVDGTRRGHAPLGRARKQLDQVDANILGVAINKYLLQPEEGYGSYPSYPSNRQPSRPGRTETHDQPLDAGRR